LLFDPGRIRIKAEITESKLHALMHATYLVVSTY
jgi:hypothetical protein